MTKIRFRPARINNDLSLFDWSERQYRDGTPYAVRRIASRLGVLPATATTLASVYGIRCAE
jgi:hypothetical protein